MTLALRILVDFLKRRGIFVPISDSTKTAAFPPAKAHVTLAASATKGKRVLFIGDVHGCLDELEELLRKCSYTEEGTVVIFVGDLVNKGPKSVEVVQLVRRIGGHSVRGNHDQAMLRELLLLQNNEAIREKYKWIRDLTKDDENYLQNLPYTINVQSLNVTVVHAGLTPGVRLEEQNPRDMITVRNYIPEECKGTSSITEGFPWGTYWQGPGHVVFGHDARRGLQEHWYTTGLDTGCVYGGYLTGLLVEDGGWDRRTVVQVKAHQFYVLTS